MANDSYLYAEAKSRFLELATHLDGELEKLYKEGILKRTDWIKLREDSKLSARAVIDALERTDYPPEMQRELVARLMTQYESSVERILDGARQRRYSIDRIETRLRAAEEKVYSNLEDALNSRSISQSQYSQTANLVKAQHKEVIAGIRSIPRNHPKKNELIDTWIADYQQEMEKLAQLPLPQLSYAATKGSSQSGEFATRRSPSVYESPQRTKRGVIRRIFSFIRRKS